MAGDCVHILMKEHLQTRDDGRHDRSELTSHGCHNEGLCYLLDKTKCLRHGGGTYGLNKATLTIETLL